jgi:hypothetical protein
MRRSLRIDQQVVATPMEPLNQPRQEMRDFRLVWFGDDPYSFLASGLGHGEKGIVQGAGKCVLRQCLKAAKQE